VDTVEDARQQVQMDAMTEPSPGSMTKRAAQGQATRGQLIEVATRLFAERGYEDTSIEAVLAAAGVSRGALYHHFAGKDALFEAVMKSVEDRINTELAMAIGGARDPVGALTAAALAWVDLAGDPVVQRVVLIDAPSVLGWERWRGMGEEGTLAAMRAMLKEVSDSGRLAAELVGPFAHMILAALDEIALVIARAQDPEAAKAEGRVAVGAMLSRLLVP
jgi:AcrR family transcriptional regulator